MAGFDPRYIAKTTNELSRMIADFKRVEPVISHNDCTSLPVMVTSPCPGSYVIKPILEAAVRYSLPVSSDDGRSDLKALSYVQADSRSLTLCLKKKPKELEWTRFEFLYKG
jgi:hypothetical protein